MRRLAAALAAGLALLLLAGPAAGARQRVFPQPEAAAQALYEAVRLGDRPAIEAVLGPGSAEVVDSGDEADDGIGRVRFLAAYQHSVRIDAMDRARARLVIGPDEWVVPFTLVRADDGWRFDARAGREQVIAGRIVRNEAAALRALGACVDAQREYVGEIHDGEGPGLYARRISSRPGLHDGLYWTPTPEHPLSPLGVLFTMAAADESAQGQARPYHGYVFRVLEAQGPHARGGALDYVVRGRLVRGFALVAYPTRHGVNGKRTFVVNHDGVAFSRDLGSRTSPIAHAMKRFDPGPGWRREAAVATPRERRPPIEQWASARGCSLCHRMDPADTVASSNGTMPLAPSWRDIAARYRDDPRAEERLAQVILEGADPAELHWRDRLEFTRMVGSAPRVGPEEARALVRSILSSR